MATIRNIPVKAQAGELVAFLEAHCGAENVLSCDIKNENGRSKGYGLVCFVTVAAAQRIHALAKSKQLIFCGHTLRVGAIRRKPEHDRVENGRLYVGNLAAAGDTLKYLWASSVNAEFLFKKEAWKMDVFISGGTEYKLQIRLDSIASVESRKINHQPCILLQLYYPPCIYTRPVDGSLFKNTFSYSKVFKIWVRTTDFTHERAFGQSFVFCLMLTNSSDNDLNNILKKFRDYDLGDYPPLYKRMWIRRGRTYASKQEVVPILCSTAGYSLPLEVEFKLNTLLQLGYISPDGLTTNLFHLLHRTSTARSLSALKKFEKTDAICLDPVNKLHTYLGSSISKRDERLLGNVLPEEGQVYVKRLLVTPSKGYFFGPDIEGSNRVTRSFSHKIDNFLRVTFTEEDYDRLVPDVLQAEGQASRTMIYNRILKILNDGVVFAGKKFNFLAFSASQLRECSVWMFSDDHDVTGDHIRNWMGEFMAIRNVAKCAARMGQSLSSSTHTVNVASDDKLDVDDIIVIDGDNRYIFSDGIGMISPGFAREVSRRCQASGLPSAFQIRYGGYKGVVAVNPCSQMKLSLRPSMLKFPSLQIGLDVLSWTRYIPCYLNREIITLLSTLGVQDEVFEQMQEQMVQKLDGMLHDAATALEVLGVLYAGESHSLIVSMLEVGYNPNMEPYLSSLLQAFRASHLFFLHTKSRIFVPKGRCLMGCLDEERVLQYGQCFVQLSLPPGGSEYCSVEEQVYSDRGVSGSDKAFVVEGPVMVTRNPCLHPGDVLVLQAIDVPELHHMVDCVVFPQQGPRPHPNECSGGDLDGDLYVVSWDHNLIPHYKVDPMNYQATKPIEVDHRVTLQEITKFFVDHMKSDNLGMIAHTYLALADSSELQSTDPSCMELAEFFSIAVDFPKTGVPAVIPPHLRVTSYPDFMEKRNKPSYVSKRVIGKLYRSVKDHKFDEVVELPPSEEYDRDLIIEGYERHLDEAVSYKESYDEKLMGILNHYRVTEAEIMSGSIRGLSRYYKRRQGDVKDRIVLAAKALVKEARGWFDEGKETGQEVYAKAFAWYHVTYNPGVRGMINRKEQLLSFPWVVHDHLLQIKRQRRSRVY